MLLHPEHFQQSSESECGKLALATASFILFLANMTLL